MQSDEAVIESEQQSDEHSELGIEEGELGIEATNSGSTTPLCTFSINETPALVFANIGWNSAEETLKTEESQTDEIGPVECESCLAWKSRFEDLEISHINNLQRNFELEKSVRELKALLSEKIGLIAQLETPKTQTQTTPAYEAELMDVDLSQTEQELDLSVPSTPRLNSFTLPFNSMSRNDSNVSSSSSDSVATLESSPALTRAPTKRTSSLKSLHALPTEPLNLSDSPAATTQMEKELQNRLFLEQKSNLGLAADLEKLSLAFGEIKETLKLRMEEIGLLQDKIMETG